MNKQVEKEYSLDEIDRRIRALTYVANNKRVPYRMNLTAKIMQLSRIREEIRFTA
jgi:hypothetical protein